MIIRLATRAFASVACLAFGMTVLFFAATAVFQ